MAEQERPGKPETDIKFDYVEERLEKQADWHSDKARDYKKNYFRTEVITIVAGALIPVINVLTIIPDDWIKILSASLGALIVISSGIGKLFKYQDNWLNYRGIVETLRREKEFYRMKVGEYDVEDPEKRNKILVERTETTLSENTAKFIATQSSKEKREPESASPQPQDGEKIE